MKADEEVKHPEGVVEICNIAGESSDRLELVLEDRG